MSVTESKSAASSSAAPRGLQDVVANESSICFIDGGKGILSYRGIDIHEPVEFGAAMG